MTKINDFIRRHLASVKAGKRAKHEAEINARFRITERGGKIYLLCYGTAVAIVNEHSNAVEITRQISSARNAALDYERECLAQTENVGKNENEQ